MCRSVPQTPQAPIWISAALAGTSGLCTSRMTGGAPGPSNVATRMLVMFRKPSERWVERVQDVGTGLGESRTFRDDHSMGERGRGYPAHQRLADFGVR
jgi:hypothetical protein